MSQPNDNKNDELRRAWLAAERSSCSCICLCALIVVVVAFLLVPHDPMYGDVYSHRRYRHSHGANADDDDDDNNGHGHSSATHSVPGGDDDNDDDHYVPLVTNYARLDTTTVSSASLVQLPVVSDERTTSWLGVTTTYDGCASDAERVQLDAASSVSGGTWLVSPTASVQLDEQHGRVVFVLDLPYSAADGAFVASFEPMHADSANSDWSRRTDLLHTPGTCQSSLAVASNVSAAELDVQMWSHAPNALYASAFNASRLRSGANGWTPRATSCARYTLSWSADASALAACRNSDGSTLPFVFVSTTRAVSLSGTLWLHYVSRAAAESSEAAAFDVQSWPFTFSLDVDRYQSKLALVDVPVTPFDAHQVMPVATEGTTDLVSLHASSLRWQTRTSLASTWFDEKTRALFIRLTSVSVVRLSDLIEAAHVDNASQLLLDTLPHSAPRVSVDSVRAVPALVSAAGQFTVKHVKEDGDMSCVFIDNTNSHAACCTNWTLSLESSDALYEGRFEVQLSTKQRVRFDVAITDPSTNIVDIDQLQTEITSHLNSAATKTIHEEAFVGGDRVCMQTYAVGPHELMQSIDVRTVAAWLCVDDDRLANKKPAVHAMAPANPQLAASRPLSIENTMYTHASGKSGCSARRHSIQLIGDAPNDTQLSERELDTSRRLVERTYAPSLHEPGAYGSWSSALCFNVSSLFMDEHGNSVHRMRYYFQSEVVVLPTDKRRVYPEHAEHRTFSSFVAAARHTASRPLDEHTALLARLVVDRLTAPTQLTSSQLGKLLDSLDATNKLDRFHTATFDVSVGTTRAERHLYHVDQATDIRVMVLVVFLGIVIALSTLACLCALQSRRADSSQYQSRPVLRT